MVVDPHDDGAAFVAQQVNDLGLLLAQNVDDGMRNRIVRNLESYIVAVDRQLEAAAARQPERIGCGNCTAYTGCTGCSRTLPHSLSIQESFTV
ncbi:hypothetical protein [Roseiarcus sp.]|uniref:hypothetical protein n=1 Tax=Roseiarcus sp. TaxID=1969460 RepID=UPI003F9DCA4F